MMQNTMNLSNDQRGLFLASREDYIHKIEKLLKLVNEKYPELTSYIEIPEKDFFYNGSSIEDLKNYYKKLYNKVQEFNIPRHRPYWIFNTKFYS